MRVTENNHYGKYLKDGFALFFSQTTNYIYVGLIILAFGLCWNKDGLGVTFKIFIILTNGLMVASFLTELLMTLIYKVVRRNKYITCILVIGSLTIVNIFSFDDNALYWSFATGVIFFVPILIFLLVKKVFS